jgi:outer membrane protein assembly factor BamB
MSSNWPAYLDGPLHSSYNAEESAITTANARAIVKKWEFQGGGGYLSSPTVADGSVYIGANNGWLYQLDASSGRLLHRIFLGAVNITSCPPPPTGMVSTATVALNPRTGRPTVYASGANGYLYALNAANLGVEWRAVIAIPSKTVNNFFDWSSPTVANGRIYVGVSSNCDSPLVRAGVDAYNQETGAKLGEFYTVPKGWVGGSVWSSVAVGSNGDVYASTGNGPEDSAKDQLIGDSESLIKLSGTLRFLHRFQVPPSDEGFDTDFGASPVLFGPYVGACNKNGTFYALAQSTMKLAWKRVISGPGGGNELCIAAPVWNGRDLFFGTPAVTIGSSSYEGSVQERTASGALKWVTGLPNAIDGSPTLDGSGVLALGTYDSTSTPNATYLLNAVNGKIIRNLVAGGVFAQSVFAENWLFTANQYGVYGWGVGKAA